MRPPRRERRGVVLIVLLVLLVAIVAVAGTLTWTALASRKFLHQRENRLRAEWLARGGIERARAQAARGDDPVKGEWRPLGERGLAAVEVQTKVNGFEVKCTATVPADEPTHVVREASGFVSRK